MNYELPRGILEERPSKSAAAAEKASSRAARYRLLRARKKIRVARPGGGGLSTSAPAGVILISTSETQFCRAANVGGRRWLKNSARFFKSLRREIFARAAGDPIRGAVKTFVGLDSSRRPRVCLRNDVSGVKRRNVCRLGAVNSPPSASVGRPRKIA